MVNITVNIMYIAELYILIYLQHFVNTKLHLIIADN